MPSWDQQLLSFWYLSLPESFFFLFFVSLYLIAISLFFQPKNAPSLFPLVFRRASSFRSNEQRQQFGMGLI